MSINEIDPAEISTILARPTQLLENAKLSCSEEKACNQLWLRVATKKPSISETRVMNGFEDVNQRVSQMLIPMTSDLVALQMAKAVQNATNGCHKT